MRLRFVHPWFGERYKNHDDHIRPEEVFLRITTRFSFGTAGWIFLKKVTRCRYVNSEGRCQTKLILRISKTSVGHSVDLWISTGIATKQSVVIQLTCGSPQELLKNKCGNSNYPWISTRITAKQVWQFSWPVDLHKNYYKTSVAVQLGCGSPQELLQNKCGNSNYLWISTGIATKQVWQFKLPVDLHKNYCKTSVAIQLTFGSPQELLKIVWQFNWPVDLHTNYCKTSVVIQLTFGSPQEFLKTECGNSVDMWILRVTANNIRRRNLQKNYGEQMSA